MISEEQIRQWAERATAHLDYCARCFLLGLAEKLIKGGVAYKGDISDEWRSHGWTTLLIPELYV